MNLEDFQFDIEEKVLSYIIEDDLKIVVDKAWEFFEKSQKTTQKISVMDRDFNSWLIYDYKMDNNKTLLESYFLKYSNDLPQAEKNILQQTIHSVPSIYVLKERNGDHGLFQDIFQNTEYLIKEDRFEDYHINDLVFSRVIKVEENYLFFGNKSNIPSVFKTTISRNIIAHFEDYKSQNQYPNWDSFLDKNRILLYKYSNVVADVLNESVEENDEKYRVWQSTYLISDFKKVEHILKQQEFIKLDDEEYGSVVFKIFHEEHLLAEFVLTKNRGEIECNSAQDRKKAREILESALGEYIKHYKDEVIGIDDII